MNFWNNLRQTWQHLNSSPEIKQFIQSPITKIVGINTALFLFWRIKGIPETFLVKHFSFERFNLRENRFHTMLTYAFSHFGFFKFFFDMLIFISFGRNIRMGFGNKMIWGLYLTGALGGAISMSMFGLQSMPGTVIPQVGSDAALSAMITFYGLLNHQQSVLLFFFPIRMWVLLGIMGAYSIMEPSKQNFGGMLAGLLIYQLFKVKMI